MLIEEHQSYKLYFKFLQGNLSSDFPHTQSGGEKNSRPGKKSGGKTQGRRNIKQGKACTDSRLETLSESNLPLSPYVVYTGDHAGRNQCTRKGCNWTFLTVAELKVHMQEVHQASPQVCSHCNKVFGSRAGLWYHEKEHEGKFRFICPLCNKGFNRKEQYNTHLKIHASGSGSQLA